MAALVLMAACGGGGADKSTAPTPESSDFGLTATAQANAQAGGIAGTIVVTATRVGTFSSAVSVTLVGLPAGATTSPVLPADVVAGTPLSISISVPKTTEARAWTLTVHGTAGALAHDATVSFAVSGAADFDVTVAPASPTLRAGTQVTGKVSISARNGFADSVTLDMPGATGGLTFDPSRLRLAPGQAADVTIAASTVAPVATTNINLSATAPGISKSVPLAVSVVPNTWYHRVGTGLAIDRISGNDSMRVVVDTTAGAAITEISFNGRNVLSPSKGNRGVQAVLFDGIYAYDDCRGCSSSSIGYMPAQEGDRFGHASRVTAMTVASDQLYARVAPYDWAPDSRHSSSTKPVADDIILEQWVAAVPSEPRAISIRYRVTHFGADLHAVAGHWLPALNAAPDLDQFTTYSGTSPWTNGAAATTTWAAGQSQNIATTEQWAAWSSASGTGVALFVPGDFTWMPARRDAGGYPSGATPFNRVGGNLQHALRPNEVIDRTAYIVVGDPVTARQVITRLRTGTGPVDHSEGFGYIDVPAGNSVISGTIAGRGWALDNVGVTRIDVTVDGRTVATTVPTDNRTDLLPVFPGTSLRAGFRFQLDTRTLADGLHDFSARIFDAAGNVGSVTFGQRVTINNGGTAYANLNIAAGAPEVVVDGPATACSGDDILDMPPRAIRMADGSLAMSVPNAPVIYLFRGPDFDHLRKDCNPVLTSPQSDKPETWAHWYWISSLFREGNTVHALLHTEYHDPVAANCKPGDKSAANPCWYNSISHAISTDGARTFSTLAPPNQVVAPAPERWDPSVPWFCDEGTFYCPHYGYEASTNIFAGPDGAYYAGFSSHPGGQAPGLAGWCLMRTTTLGDPKSWRAWDGTAFQRSLADPYISGTQYTPPCEPIDPRNTHTPSSITYNAYLGQYLAIVEMHNQGGYCGFGYSVSSDLLRWTRPVGFLRVPVTAPTECRATPANKTGSSGYASLIDPVAGGDNFDKSGQRPYLYFVRWTGANEAQRQLVRVQLTLTKQ